MTLDDQVRAAEDRARSIARELKSALAEMEALRAQRDAAAKTPAQRRARFRLVTS